MPNYPLSNPERPELSEAKYRTYETLFLQLLETYPAPFKIKPTKGAATSLVVRIREAANAVLVNSEKFAIQPLINLDTFRSVWSRVQVSISSDCVLIAERQIVIDSAKARVADASSKATFTLSNPTLTELSVIASAYQRQACAEPILFIGEVPSFIPPFGVAFEQTSEGWMML